MATRPEGHRGGSRWDRLYRRVRWIGPLYAVFRMVWDWM